MSLGSLLGCAFFSGCVTLTLMMMSTPLTIVCLITLVIGIVWPFMEK